MLRNGMLFTLLLMSCSDNGFTQLTQTDVFQQNRLNTVDVLIVVDNSCSMIEEQKKLAGNFDSFIQFFDSADVDWQIGVVTTDTEQEQFSGHLLGGDDEIILAGPDGTPEDSVAYTKAWPVGPGVVFSLDPSWESGTGNDLADHWCTDQAATPGAANPGCGGGGEGASADRGAVIITEFLPDPDGVADEDGEWVEVTNVSDADVDLTGYTLLDAGRNSFAIPSGTTIRAGRSLVFGRSADTARNGGVPVDVAMGTDFTLNNHDLYLTRDTEGASEIFAEMVAQGTSGSGTEMGLEAPRMALSEPLVSGDNAGFLRDDANLSLLIVSDEQDSSPLSVPDYLNFFASLKGEAAYRDHSLMNISAVVGSTPPDFDGEPSCSSANGNATYGSRYVYAANQTEGLLNSICDEDFSPIVEQLGLTLSGLVAEFTLSRVPVLDTLKVALYASDDSGSKIRDLERDVDFTYVEESNSILFQNDQVPESQQYVVADYRVQSGG